LVASVEVDEAVSAVVNRAMTLMHVYAESRTDKTEARAKTALRAATERYADAYRELRHTMRRELGVEPP
jgi:hypothetical protein